MTKSFDQFVDGLLSELGDEIHPEAIEASHLQTDIEYTCAYCYSSNPVQADPSAGRIQSYVEDCQTCCRPNSLKLSWDESSEDWWVESEPES